MCIISIVTVFAAQFADGTGLALVVPDIQPESVDALLSVMAASMLVIATFSVTSMVSAYGAAASTATPRAFILVVADNASQNALSTFVGSFIFSVVALTATKSNFFDKAGTFILFVMTILVFAIVIYTFVRWVDRIARLGRMGSTISKVETATADALKRRRSAPTLHGVKVGNFEGGKALFSASVGYVQHINVSALQQWAEKNEMRLMIAALPGTFATPDRALVYAMPSNMDYTKLGDGTEIDYSAVVDCFQIGDNRLFDDDPRFGLVVLSEIASRALSPAVNDPGTAINVLGTMLRLFVQWHHTQVDEDKNTPHYDRIAVPEILLRDMFDDAFTAIARDGAALVEVSLRLQKTLHSLASTGDVEMRDAAIYHSQLALKRAKTALNLEEDFAIVEDAAKFAK